MDHCSSKPIQNNTISNSVFKSGDGIQKSLPSNQVVAKIISAFLQVKLGQRQHRCEQDKQQKKKKRRPRTASKHTECWCAEIIIQVIQDSVQSHSSGSTPEQFLGFCTDQQAHEVCPTVLLTGRHASPSSSPQARNRLPHGFISSNLRT